MTRGGGAYEVEWGSPALRTIERLPEKAAVAAVEFIYASLAAEPHPVGRPLRFDLEGRHSARRGDYRIIYRIDDEAHTVVIDAIAHRSDVYRPR